MLGDESLLTPIDEQMQEVLKLVTNEFTKRKPREKIQQIKQLFSDDVLMPASRAYWSRAPEKSPAGLDEEVLSRLTRLDPALAESYEQVVVDLEVDRLSYRGPASELREVLTSVLHKLAPTAEVEATDWYRTAQKSGTRKEPTPTRAERVRFILRARATRSETAETYAESVEERLARVVNATYSKGSAQAHTGVEAGEVAQQLRYQESSLACGAGVADSSSDRPAWSGIPRLRTTSLNDRETRWSIRRRMP